MGNYITAIKQSGSLSIHPAIIGAPTGFCPEAPIRRGPCCKAFFSPYGSAGLAHCGRCPARSEMVQLPRGSGYLVSISSQANFSARPSNITDTQSAGWHLNSIKTTGSNLIITGPGKRQLQYPQLKGASQLHSFPVSVGPRR